MKHARKKNITLRDIAQKAGVSTALVSCILNGKGRASEEVRTKVLAMLEQAGYRPRYARKSFYFIADIDRIAESGKAVPFMRMLKGVQEVCESDGIHLQVEFLGRTGSVDGRPQSQLRRILERQPGAVFVPTDEPWLEQACSLFATQGVPLMQIGYDTECERFPAVVVDSRAGTTVGIRYLLSRGHRRIGLLRWEYDKAGINSRKKLAGYKEALAEADIAFDQSLVRTVKVGQSDTRWESSRKLVEELLELGEPPDALFVDNSFLSLPLLYPQPQDGGILPERIRSLDTVHFEDWPLGPVEDIVAGKLFFPSCRTVVLAIDWEMIGAVAARMLVEYVRKGASGSSSSSIRITPALQQVEGTHRKPLESFPSLSGKGATA